MAGEAGTEVAVYGFHAFNPDTALFTFYAEGDEVPAGVADQHPSAVGREVEDEFPPGDGGAVEGFDPASNGAKEVHDYLAGLDRDTEDGAAEFERVVEAERAGKDRSTAIPD